jgi:hypothetical protein
MLGISVLSAFIGVVAVSLVRRGRACVPGLGGRGRTVPRVTWGRGSLRNPWGHV